MGPGLPRSAAAHSARPRLLALASLAVVVPLGFAVKLYDGPMRAWVADSFAGVVYEIFWCLAIFLAWPRRGAITPIAGGVLAATCALEVMQLWDHPVLHRARSTFLGRALLGNTFAWSDFLYYPLGCAAGWLWMRAILRRTGGQRHAR